MSIEESSASSEDRDLVHTLESVQAQKRPAKAIGVGLKRAKRVSARSSSSKGKKSVTIDDGDSSTSLNI